MSKLNKGPLLLAASCAVLGVCTLVVSLCTGTFLKDVSQESGQTGKECMEEHCDDEPTLAKCALCCDGECSDPMQPSLETGCVDACVEKFGGVTEAITEVAKAADRLQAAKQRMERDPSLVDVLPREDGFREDVELIELAQHSLNDTLRGLARGLVVETPMVRFTK